MAKKQENLFERKYDQKTTSNLYGKAAGHCTLCNRPVCYDKYSHTNIHTAEIAHIRAFSDLGPRADKKLSKAKRNKIENLILLCGECHSTIDKKISEEIYTVEWLKTEKCKKEKAIMEIMGCLTPKESYCIKCFSSIHENKFNFNDNDLLRECFKNGIHTKETVIDLSTNNCVETPKIIISSLNQAIKEKLEIITNNNFSNDFCVFGLGPQYFLINLGYKLSDKTNYLIYTKHRDKWILDQPIKNINEFSLIKPQITKSNEVALIISSTTIINHERVISTLGKNVDIWEIRAKNLGTDNINCLKELKQFQDLCSKTIDEIGTTYGKDKRINVFPIMCNSLSIKFGQSIFHKSQNKLLIFDTIKNRKGQVVEKSMLTL